MIDPAKLFEDKLLYPHPVARERLDRLIGLDDHKIRLSKVLGLLVNPAGLAKWAAEHHESARPMITTILNRPPLVILAGDVGSGKTELAETIGDAVGRQENIDVLLLPLSLSVRGAGKVGEMTQLISAAFDFTVKEANSLMSGDKAGGAVILLVDEADALAQTRETANTHHEDVSGVNAFIRGIDRLANQRLPAAVIMCTNRVDVLDPAVKRRAAEILYFGRPNEEMRRHFLAPQLAQLGFGPEEIETLVAATGPRNGAPGFTFSDLRHRLIPGLVLDAYPDRAIDPSRALALVEEMGPTPPFQSESAQRT